MTRPVFVRVSLLVLGVLAALACERPTFVVGEGCVLNTDCADPLVCVIGYCRRACVGSRDCGAGLRCLASPDPTVGGGCQLDSETMCLLTSDCHSADLVCQNETCTTRCASERDCVAPAACTEDVAGVRACHDTSVGQSCIWTTDCPVPLVCGPDQICRLECIEDRDCPYPRRCVASLCELPDAASPADAGP
jgi:hypothetical protein